MAPQPRRGGGGGVDVNVGGVSGGSTTNRCAEVDAFHDSISVARLVVNAIFCLAFMILFWIAWKTPENFKKKALAKVKDDKFKLGKKILPYWWLFNFAVFLQVVVFILRIVSLCLVQCDIFYIEKMTGSPDSLTKAALPLSQFSIVLILFFVAFILLDHVHKRINKTSGWISTSARAFFFVLYVIFVIVFVALYMYYYVDYEKESAIDSDAAYDKFVKITRAGDKISVAADVFGVGLAVATAVSFYSAVGGVHNMVYKTWTIVLCVIFFLYTFESFVLDAFWLNPKSTMTPAASIAVTALSSALLLGVFAAAMYTHISLAKLEVHSQIANHGGSSPPAMPQNQYQGNPHGAPYYPPQQQQGPGQYFPQQPAPQMHQSPSPPGVQHYPSPPPNQQYPSPPPNMQQYNPTPPPNMQHYPAPMQGSPPPQGQYNQQAHGYYVPPPQQQHQQINV